MVSAANILKHSKDITMLIFDLIIEFHIEMAKTYTVYVYIYILGDENKYLAI